MGQKGTNAERLPIVESVYAVIGVGYWIVFCVGAHLTQVPQPKCLIFPVGDYIAAITLR